MQSLHPVTTIRAGVPGTINELDPRKAADYVSGFILDQVFETPYATVAEQTTAKPLLFETLRGEGASGLQYSAAVRPGICFSDGTPLTPDLAARSLHGASALSKKVSIDVRGDRIWFTLTSPNPRFDLTLTHSSCALVLEKGMQLFGTGPFMFDQRPNLRMLQSADSLRLIRNPRYHRATKIDAIEFRVLRPDADGTPRTMIEALGNGTIDMTTALSASDLATSKITGFAPITRPSNSTALLFLNTEHALLRGARARHGIVAAIDLLEIASHSYGRNPAAYIATATLPPAMSRNGVARGITADAKRLIEENGLRGAQLALLVPWAPRPYLPKPLAVAQLIQRQLRDAGVIVSLRETNTSDEYFTQLAGGRFHLAIGGWIADTPDPADFFEALLASNAIGSAMFSNYSRWNHRATDSLLASFRVDPSDANRRALEQLVADEAPFLPLIYGQSSVVHARRVRDVTLSPTGSVPLGELTVT